MPRAFHHGSYGRRSSRQSEGARQDMSTQRAHGGVGTKPVKPGANWHSYPEWDEIGEGYGSAYYFGIRNLPLDLFRDPVSSSGWRLAGHRQQLDQQTVHEYAQLMRNGVTFDAITVYLYSDEDVGSPYRRT